MNNHSLSALSYQAKILLHRQADGVRMGFELLHHQVHSKGSFSKYNSFAMT